MKSSRRCEKIFSSDTALAARQRLAVAHIDAEAVIEQRCQSDAGARWRSSVDAVTALHRELFAHLPALIC